MTIASRFAVGSGTGIGLAMSRGLVGAHGGSLVLAPSAGEGACFVIRLPLAGDASQRSDSNNAVGVPQRLTPLAWTALVVDDEPEIGELLGEMLRKLRYRFEVKVSGEAAQAALMQRDYDVVLCDLRLPGWMGLPCMTGFPSRGRICVRTQHSSLPTP